MGVGHPPLEEYNRTTDDVEKYCTLEWAHRPQMPQLQGLAAGRGGMHVLWIVSTTAVVHVTPFVSTLVTFGLGSDSLVHELLELREAVVFIGAKLHPSWLLRRRKQDSQSYSDSVFTSGARFTMIPCTASILL